MSVNATKIVSGCAGIVLAAITGSVFSQTTALESYLCVADKATGFDFNKTRNEWVQANFRPTNKYVLARSKQPNFAWEVKDFGQTVSSAECRNSFNEVGNLFCSGLGGSDFRFNRNSLRYMKVYLIGYWNDGNPADRASVQLFAEGDNTPSIEIGKCSPL